jgi:heme exporter protein B
MSELAILAQLAWQDARLAFGAAGDAWLSLGFFVLMPTLFALGIGPEPQTLTPLAGALIWIGAILTTLLSLDRIIANDYADGTLDQTAMTGAPWVVIATAKALAHLLTSGGPVLIAAPAAASLLQLPGPVIGVLVLTLLLGLPLLSLLGVAAAALVLGARRGGALLALLLLPLYVPVLVFATAAIDAAQLDLSPRPHLLLLGAILAVALAVAPLATAAGLRAATR